MVETASSKGIFLFNLKISGIILCRGRVWLKIWNQSGLLAKSSLQWTWLLEKSENSGAGGRWAAEPCSGARAAVWRCERTAASEVALPAGGSRIRWRRPRALRHQPGRPQAAA